MDTRSNVVDFATYRFARDLRLAQDTPLAPARAAVSITDEAAAHRRQMLEHLARTADRALRTADRALRTADRGPV